MNSTNTPPKEYTVGIDIGGTNTKIGIVDGTTLLCTSSIPTDVAQGPERVLRSIATEVRYMCTASTRLKAVGIGLPGLVENGVLVGSANFPGWSNVPVQAMFQAEFGCPVQVQMDINAIAKGELWAGGHGDRKRLFVFTLGTGVGAAAVLDNKVYGGAGGFMLAGPFSHPEEPSGFLRLEDLVSGPSIIRRTCEYLAGQSDSPLKQYADAGTLTVEAIAQAAARGDVAANRIWANTGLYLGWAAVSVAYLLFPERVIVGGGVSLAGDLLMQPAREFYQRYLPRELSSTCDIVVSALGSDAGIIGAAVSATESLTGQE